ncbi:hypothetical protein [Thalassococcus profundi]|uniref:hypothetical protein n=1 Tax=Thalassococcus profundi TaxID=2282382 RepID=UPI004059F9A3
MTRRAGSTGGQREPGATRPMPARDGAASPGPERHRQRDRAALYRARDRSFADWAGGAGVLTHDDLTQVRVHDMVDTLHQRGAIPDKAAGHAILRAADRVANAAMWLVVHMTYARTVRTDGQALGSGDFKPNPDGHTGGSLNMVPAYVGYLAANALCGTTRSWLMGQGHCVAAIDAVNLIVDNMSTTQSQRYAFSDEGLTRFVRDFYSYEIGADGRPSSPLGSHVNAHTAGGLIEGGYLGFAGLLYGHMPEPGERLVAFLSDGAFEEQRGSDWAPRWWRAEDTGLVAPIMIANGRRIDQRTTMAQIGGSDWLRRHLRLNGFDPIDFDGRDPAAFAWAILEMEERLGACAAAALRGEQSYPIPLHYGIAETTKGFGFPGAGTNRAHNLPLEGNPRNDAAARRSFNEGARKLWVGADELATATRQLNNHSAAGRTKERDHPLISRKPVTADLPEQPWSAAAEGEPASPMAGIDQHFRSIVLANPRLRVRVGNPDEMRSNRMNATLDQLKHRVAAPEPGLAESVSGSVITALNEEAVICSVLANKGGLNIAVSYEAFATKMLGALRQDLIFTRHMIDAGRKPYWLGVPLIATSHTWENGKNELSHQDTTVAETMWGEMSDLSRVVFPVDWNSAIACLDAVYRSRGSIWTMIVPKREVPNRLSPELARMALKDGAVCLRDRGGDAPELLLVAVGAYQLGEALRASARLDERGVRHRVILLLEPGRFRLPRDDREQEHSASKIFVDTLFPESVKARVFLSHTRPEPFGGLVRPLDTGPRMSRFLGFCGRGGTLDTNGMLIANRSTWAHVIVAAAGVLGVTPKIS